MRIFEFSRQNLDVFITKFPLSTSTPRGRPEHRRRQTRPFPTPSNSGGSSRSLERERGPGRDGRDGASRPRDRPGRHLDVGGAGRELGRAVTRRSGIRKRDFRRPRLESGATSEDQWGRQAGGETQKSAWLLLTKMGLTLKTSTP